MAATAIAGISGAFAYTGHVARIMQWELTTVQDVNDCSGFGSPTNWRENLAGMKGWRVRASGYLTASAASTAPAADFSATGDSTVGITVTLTVKTGNTYTGTAFPASFVTGTGINGNATFSAELVGTAALTEAWSTT